MLSLPCRPETAITNQLYIDRCQLIRKRLLSLRQIDFMIKSSFLYPYLLTYNSAIALTVALYFTRRNTKPPHAQKHNLPVVNVSGLILRFLDKRYNNE